MSAFGPTPEVNPAKADIAIVMSVVGGEAEVGGTDIDEGWPPSPEHRCVPADFCFPTITEVPNGQPLVSD